MGTITKKQLVDFVGKNIQQFHDKRLKSLSELKLNTVLKKKNPYLFKAKNILLAEDFIRTITDAFLSSQEEAVFGQFLEELAIFSCETAFRGRKSSAEGIDLEFERDGTIYLVAIKSGPNWGNSQQIRRMQDNFNQAKRVLRTSSSRSKNIMTVNGCCYGKEPNPNKEDYLKLCGQEFWTLISGNDDLYIDIIEPLGHKAKEKNDGFEIAYAAMINKFTKQFMEVFCFEGVIDWEKLVRFNSGKSNYGKILREARKAKGITIVEFAKKIGISQADIVRIEKGEKMPSEKEVEAIESIIS